MTGTPESAARAPVLQRTPGSRVVFALTAVANRLLVPLLLSRAGRTLGHRLAVVEYTGRRTGRTHRLVTRYTRKGTAVVITVGFPQRKTWWRNLEGGRPVRLWLAGEEQRAYGRVVQGDDALRVVAEPYAPVSP